MKIQVLAEREHKIQTEVKEIRKVFYCELCNKQYKSVMEFEGHLSSYDHNHKKRFKGMKEMQGASSRDDRQKREQQRLEREMAKMSKMADARKQQQQQEVSESGLPVTEGSRAGAVLTDQDQRKALKFGFSSKPGASKSKNPSGFSAKKKPKIAVAAVFGDEEEED